MNQKPIQDITHDNCNNLNKDFWNDYYNNTIDDINRPSTFASFVQEKYMSNPTNVLDLGAGNCRDSIFFSKNDNQTKAIDYNGILKEEYNNLQLIKEDVELFLSTKTKLDNYELVYMRWFLHAMPYDKAGNIFKLASNILKTDSLICIELRSLNDAKLKEESIYNELDKSYTTTHKRWLYNKEMLEQLTLNNNCNIVYLEEGYFSPNKNTETHDPLLIRMICRKC